MNLFEQNIVDALFSSLHEKGVDPKVTSNIPGDEIGILARAGNRFIHLYLLRTYPGNILVYLPMIKGPKGEDGECLTRIHREVFDLEEGQPLPIGDIAASVVKRLEA